MDTVEKFIVAKCETKWDVNCCKRGCILIFPDDPEIREAMRIALKMIIAKCPIHKAKFKC